MKIGIIGLGLMGGSLGIALKSSNPGYRIIGYDHNERHRSQALGLGLVDDIAPSMETIRECDVIFLAIPVDGIIATLQTLKTVKPRNVPLSIWEVPKQRSSHPSRLSSGRILSRHTL